MAIMSVVKAASLLLLAAASTSAAPALLTARDEPRCSIVASMRIDPTRGEGVAWVDVNLYDNSGYNPPDTGISYPMTVDQVITDTTGLEQTLWSTKMVAADGSKNGGIMDIEFVYGPSADGPAFWWLDCPVTIPLDADGKETRQCWFPCSGYTGGPVGY